jgi:hypothetical protein
MKEEEEEEEEILVLTDSPHTNDLAKTLEVKNQKKNLRIRKCKTSAMAHFKKTLKNKTAPKIWHQSL